MPYPNLVLAGAPKSGTSSLFKCLVSHPEISAISMDETYYLLDKDNPYLNKFNYHTHGFDFYTSKVTGNKKTKIFLEYCTHYMYQETALNILSNFNVQPYIIFLLRQPSKRTFSSFSFAKNNKLSIHQGFSFSDFIDLLLNKNFDKIQQYCLTEKSFFARKTEIIYSQYYDYLSKWTKKIPESKFKLILFEDLIQNSDVILKSICQDLDIDDSFYNGYNIINQNKTVKVKHKQLHKQLLSLKSIIPKSNFQKILSNIYWNIQKDSSPLEKFDSITYDRLNDYFSPYNQRLSQEFNLNLDLWN